MDSATVVDDNFFIEEPINLIEKYKIKFYDPSSTPEKHLVELISKKQHHHYGHDSTMTTPNKNNNTIHFRLQQMNKSQTCRLAYDKKLKELHYQFQHQYEQQQQQNQPILPEHQQQTKSNMVIPKKASIITKLELLCQEIYINGDIVVAQQAVDALIFASKSGCCFLEKYLVMILNFCTMKHYQCSSLPSSTQNVPMIVDNSGNEYSINNNNTSNNNNNNNNNSSSSNDSMKIRLEELLSRVLVVNFDRQQMIENLRRLENKLNSVDHIIQLLTRVQDMLDYREHNGIALNWLLVILDAYFVEIATSDNTVEIIDKISEQVNFQCALLRETESTKCLLRSITEHLDNATKKFRSDDNNPLRKRKSEGLLFDNDVDQVRHKRPNYIIEYLEF